MISCFITTSPTKVVGSMRSISTGIGSPGFIPSGVALTTMSKPAGSFEPVSTTQRRIVRRAAGRRGLHRRRVGVEEREPGDPGPGERGGDRRADPAASRRRARRRPRACGPCAGRRARSPRRRTCRRRAGRRRRARTALHEPATARGGRHLVEEAHGGDLVRHGDQRAADVGEAEDEPQEGGVVLGPARPSARRPRRCRASRNRGCRSSAP